MSPNYPLVLDVAGRRVLVVGGGPVAARRAAELAAAQADVLVVAPKVCEALIELVEAVRVRWEARDFSPGDTAGAWLVQTATGDAATDTAVANEAAASRIWCVQASTSSDSTAWTPAVARGADGVLISVSGGRDPGRARAIRDAVAAGIETGHLPIRPTRTAPGLPMGSVHLVGGGPGAVGLLTVRGRYLLAQAHVVVVDRLAPRAVLAELSDEVEIIDCGKAPGHHQMTQDEINTVLIDRARQGLRVVRLKGGDPFVLGRGAEEVLACQAAGVPVEVVPGVTSAISVPAAAGIPLTHRGITSSFTVLSGHDGIHQPVTDSARTQVVLMGVEQLGQYTAALIVAGWPTSTPVAVIERGWLPDQRTTVGILSDIREKAAERNVISPAVVVVGDVVALRTQLGDLNGWQP